jgi:UDP-N-acetylglucosamine 1-carboxyvinyltransferase
MPGSHARSQAERRVELEVHGGPALRGSAAVDGSKNAALPLLAAAAALSAPVDLAGLPASADVDAMTGLLVRAGWVISRRDHQDRVQIGAPPARGSHPGLAGASAIRASYYLVAPLIAAYGRAVLPRPGGCAVGDRGMEVHFTVYEAFGDRVSTGAGGYTVQSRPAGQDGTVAIALPFRSRGATVAALLRAVVAGRPVVIGNPNLSAELHSLYRALTAAGCSVEVTAAQVSLVPAISGSGVLWSVPGDKIEAGTLACAIAATGGHGEISGVPAEDLTPLVDALNLLGVPAAASAGGDAAAPSLTVPGGWEPTGASLRAFASLAPGGLDADWEPGLMALALGLPGTHGFADAINPGRHGNLIPQLRRLGAVITEAGPTQCTLTGPQSLVAAPVEATDIRTGSALLIAALTAKGTTTVTGLGQLRRGHADLPGKLAALGACLAPAGRR